jgi:hypothetical protein
VHTDPLSANTYTYVNGDPVNLDDPTGHYLACDPDTNCAAISRKITQARVTWQRAEAARAEFYDLAWQGDAGAQATALYKALIASTAAKLAAGDSVDAVDAQAYADHVRRSGWATSDPVFNALIDFVGTGGLRALAEGGTIALRSGLKAADRAAARLAAREAMVPALESLVDAAGRPVADRLGGTLAEYLASAVEDFDSSAISFTRGQARALARATGTPKEARLFALFRGERVDNAVMSSLRRAVETGGDSRLPTDLYITPRGRFGPDVFDPSTNSWYDFTTVRSWPSHFQRYEEWFPDFNARGVTYE